MYVPLCHLTHHFLTGYHHGNSAAAKIYTQTSEHGLVCGQPVYCHPNMLHVYLSLPPSSPLNLQLLEGRNNNVACPIVLDLLQWDVHIGVVRAIVAKLAGAINTRSRIHSRREVLTFLPHHDCRRLRHNCPCLRTNHWLCLSIRMSPPLKKMH